MTYEELKAIVANNVCAQCEGELTIHTNPEKGTLEVWCPHHPDHHGYIERESLTEAYRRGAIVPGYIEDNIKKRMLPERVLPGGYPLGTALALIKARFPRADLDDPSAALFVTDCIRLDLDPLLGEIVPVTFKVTDKQTNEVRKLVQPVLTEDGWLSLASRACPDRWAGAPRTMRIDDYLMKLEEHKGKSAEEIKELAREIKRDICKDAEAYLWVAIGKIKLDDQVIETEPAYGWLRTGEMEKDEKKQTPKDYLPGNQARVRAIKRWVRETFPDAKAKMKQLTSEWLTRAKDVDEIQDLITAEYHIVAEIAPTEETKTTEAEDEKVGARAARQSRAQSPEPQTDPENPMAAWDEVRQLIKELQPPEEKVKAWWQQAYNLPVGLGDFRYSNPPQKFGGPMIIAFRDRLKETKEAQIQEARQEELF